MLARKAKLPRGQQSLPNLLLALGAHGLGALSYFQENTPRNRFNYAPIYKLEKLLADAEKYEKDEIEDDSELRDLFIAASSPGGARPKALIMDESVLWIAKFPSVKDTYAVENIEAATLSLARQAGLEVPEFRLVSDDGHQVLMVRRFDVTEAGGRCHKISMQTLLKVEGWYNLAYRDLFEVLRQHSAQPEVDLPMLFRQMVFNAIIGNTDDHLKNFTMIRDETGYRLSPAYDLLPDIAGRREHVLMFEHDHFVQNLAVLERIGRACGIRKSREVIDQVKTVIANWRDEFERYAVPAEDARRLGPGIEKMLVKD